jgi:hypothetical protein
MNYSVKVNTHIKNVVIHKSPCSFIRLHGGTGSFGQIIWKDFATLSLAVAWAKNWRAKGLELKYCKHCNPS